MVGQAIRNTYEVNLLLETGGGGAARHVFDLYRGLKLRGRTVRLILSLRRADPPFLAELATIDPEDVYQIELRRSPGPLDIVAAVNLRRFLRKRAYPQIVHAHSTKAGAIAAMLRSDRTATLFTPHAYRGMDNTLGGWQGILVRTAEKVISSAHRKVIALSPDEYRYASGLGVPDEQLSLIKNGLDLEAVRQVSRRASTVGPENVCDVGFVGRLVHQKNPLTFLKTLEVMNTSGFPFRGHIIGDGPLRQMLEEYARDKGLIDYLTFYGTVSAIPLMVNLDLLIHTSVYESCPYSLLEAIALGVPIIAVSNAGSKAIFGDRLELIKGHLQYAEIAKAAMHMFLDSPSRDCIRVTYRQIEGEIGLDTMIAKIEAEYNAVCSNCFEVAADPCAGSESVV